MLNELTYYAVSMMYMLFTDFNPNAQIKIYVGWLVVITAIGNLIWPNLTIMLRGIWPDIKSSMNKSEKLITRKQRRTTQAFEKFRQKFIKDKEMKLKAEYEEK